MRFLQGSRRSRHRFDRDLAARGHRGVIQWFLIQIYVENVIKYCIEVYYFVILVFISNIVFSFALTIWSIKCYVRVSRFFLHNILDRNDSLRYSIPHFPQNLWHIAYCVAQLTAAFSLPDLKNKKNFNKIIISQSELKLD